MAKTLSAKNRKRRKDQATAYATGKAPKKCKIAVMRSRKAKAKNANRQSM